MYLCIRYLAFLTITLAKVSAHYHYVITFYAQDGEDENSRRTHNSVEFDLPFGVSSGWCAPEQTEPKNVPGTVTLSGKTPWNCTFYAMMNRSANCITTFRTAEKNSKYVINLNIEKDKMFNIESNETETQINFKSPFNIDLGTCVLNGKMVNRYYADSKIILDHTGKWFCRFYLQRRRPVNILINLRSSEHNRIYETVEGIEPIPITQESENQDEMNAVLTMSNIQCANNLPIIRPKLNSSYISLENSEARSDIWECNFHNNALDTFCIFKVREILSSNNYMMGYPGEFPHFDHSGYSMTMTHVFLSSIGVAVLVIILLVCGICYYKNKVNKIKENVIPPNIIGRAPLETPPEVVYDCVYSHPAGLKRPGIKKEKNTDQTQLIT